MKKNTVLSIVILIGILCYFSISVLADCPADPVPDPNAPANTLYNDLWVSSGGNSFTSMSSTTTQNRSTCYMRLRWFKFEYYSDCVMPSGNYIYSRLYTLALSQASNYASFSGSTSPGNYNYSYKAGYGSTNQSYKLKTNSSYSVTGYEVKFDWSANPHP